MAKLRKTFELETAFGVYRVTESIGEGGAGRVYGAAGPDGPVAIKVMSANRMNTDKRRRFKNEIGFLSKAKHPNIVAMSDYGFTNEGAVSVPFYVMSRYDCSLRDVIKDGLAAADVLPLYARILDGVEAAHLHGATHRDLKPENILFNRRTKEPAVADFGIASFTDDLMITAVETGPTDRLANWQYAAPEQRVNGRDVGKPADVYALGMILNELFTGNTPHGTDYETIGKRSADFAFLDSIVQRTLRQNPAERYPTIEELKKAIAAHKTEFLALQKLSKLNQTVIPASAIDDPLAHESPKVTDVDWNNGVLSITLDRDIHSDWINALRRIGNYTSLMGVGPDTVQFSGRIATLHRVPPQQAQVAINHFKDWLPHATRTLKMQLEEAHRRRQYEMQQKLIAERQAEEQRASVLKGLKF